jgi:hypothetical protein
MPAERAADERGLWSATTPVVAEGGHGWHGLPLRFQGEGWGEGSAAHGCVTLPRAPITAPEPAPHHRSSLSLMWYNGRGHVKRFALGEGALGDCSLAWRVFEHDPESAWEIGSWEGLHAVEQVHVP